MEKYKKLSSMNQKMILNSIKCGCFSCLQIFSPKEVTKWKGEKEGRTALCPICDSPTVLGDGSEEIKTIDEAFLKKIFEGEI